MKKMIKSLFSLFGFDIHRVSKVDESRRFSLKGSMQTARGTGFHPRTIIDVGAARGTWSLEVADVWPESRFMLIDPLEENNPYLQHACASIKNADYRILALMDYEGSTEINVHDDLDGSSVFRERETNINGVARKINCTTIDRLDEELDFGAPILLKADVQGAELKVLAGAEALLPRVEMLVLEVLMFDYFQGRSPQLFEMVDFLKKEGFVAWDILGPGYRMIDNALSQLDMVFVREKGMFRKIHQYATETQRDKQMEEINASNRKRVRQR